MPASLRRGTVVEVFCDTPERSLRAGATFKGLYAADALDVLVAVFLAEAETLRQVGADSRRRRGTRRCGRTRQAVRPGRAPRCSCPSPRRPVNQIVSPDGTGAGWSRSRSRRRGAAEPVGQLQPLGQVVVAHLVPEMSAFEHRRAPSSTGCNGFVGKVDHLLESTISMPISSCTAPSTPARRRAANAALLSCRRRRVAATMKWYSRGWADDRVQEDFADRQSASPAAAGSARPSRL